VARGSIGAIGKRPPLLAEGGYSLLLMQLSGDGRPPASFAERDQSIVVARSAVRLAGGSQTEAGPCGKQRTVLSREPTAQRRRRMSIEPRCLAAHFSFVRTQRPHQGKRRGHLPVAVSAVHARLCSKPLASSTAPLLLLASCPPGGICLRSGHCLVRLRVANHRGRRSEGIMRPR
jgi:hypothetical protein